MCIIEDTTLIVPNLKDVFTRTQYRNIGITSVGFSVKETAEMTYSSGNTVQTHIKDAKEIAEEEAERIARAEGLERKQTLSRSELRFAFLCQFLGHDPSEVRKQILASVMSMVVILTTAASVNTADRRRVRVSSRRIRIEYSEIHNTSF